MCTYVNFFVAYLSAQRAFKGHITNFLKTSLKYKNPKINAIIIGPT